MITVCIGHYESTLGENVTSHLEYPPLIFHSFCDDSNFLDEDTFELEPYGMT